MFKFSNGFITAIHTTWQAIGPDLLQCYEATGEEPENEAVVEGCLDADHIATYGGPTGKAAQEEYRSRIAVVGYAQALREAVRSLPCPLV